MYKVRTYNLNNSPTMAQEKLEELSVEALMKRKKFAALLIGVMIGVILATLVLLGISMAINKKINVGVFVPDFVLFFIILFMYTGIKKINIELKRRETIK